MSLDTRIWSYGIKFDNSPQKSLLGLEMKFESIFCFFYDPK